MFAFALHSSQITGAFLGSIILSILVGYMIARLSGLARAGFLRNAFFALMAGALGALIASSISFETGVNAILGGHGFDLTSSYWHYVSATFNWLGFLIFVTLIGLLYTILVSRSRIHTVVCFLTPTISYCITVLIYAGTFKEILAF